MDFFHRWPLAYQQLVSLLGGGSYRLEALPLHVGDANVSVQCWSWWWRDSTLRWEPLLLIVLYLQRSDI